MALITRAQVVACARSYIGVPFRHMGRTRQEGLDCIGLPLAVMRDLGIPFPDYPDGNYTRRGAGFQLVQHCCQYASPVPISKCKDGDVLVFQEGQIPCHTGILTHRGESRYVVQALGKTSWMRVVECPMAGEWSGKLRFAFHMPGVED